MHFFIGTLSLSSWHACTRIHVIIYIKNMLTWANGHRMIDSRIGVLNWQLKNHAPFLPSYVSNLSSRPDFSFLGDTLMQRPGFPPWHLSIHARQFRVSSSVHSRVSILQLAHIVCRLGNATSLSVSISTDLHFICARFWTIFRFPII